MALVEILIQAEASPIAVQHATQIARALIGQVIEAEGTCRVIALRGHEYITVEWRFEKQGTFEVRGRAHAAEDDMRIVSDWWLYSKSLWDRCLNRTTQLVAASPSVDAPGYPGHPAGGPALPHSSPDVLPGRPRAAGASSPRPALPSRSCSREPAWPPELPAADQA